ncbi:MAG TPA: FliH/SctL family protein [Alphaproteobacteria bacterium]|nr:FliH/SctL family protein [Alphaproteobacteria bacterium]
MSDHAKYLFERTFDEDGSEPNPELEAAFARGHEAGVEATRVQSERMVAEAAAQIVERLTSLEAIRTELEGRMSKQAITVAADLVRKMMPALVARGGMAEIEAVIEDALGRMLDEPRVVFRMPDAMLDTLQPHIAKMSGKAGYSGEVVLLADDRMGLSDCLVEWADGGAERNVERLWAEVEDILTRTLDAQSDGASVHISNSTHISSEPGHVSGDAGRGDPALAAPELDPSEHQITKPAPIPDEKSNLGVSRDG